MMELEPSSIEFKPRRDGRPRMPEPPPVRLVAIEDVHVSAFAGAEVELDEFYITLLKFEREDAVRERIVYKAENFRLCFDVLEPPIQREDFRPIGIEVLSLRELEKELIAREIQYEWQKGLLAGQHTILLQDPAGNCVQIGETRRHGI
jgi:hypothetical protein